MAFPTTQWTQLAVATLHGDTQARRALGDFFERYREPVICALRRRGVAEPRLEDMTHDFLLQLMEASSLRRADPALGRFRQYLHGALARFLASDCVRGQRKKRGGGAEHLSLDAGTVLADEAAATADQELDTAALDRDWALAVFGRALAEVDGEWAAAGKAARFSVMRAFLPGSAETITQHEAAERLGLSDGNFRSELFRLREQVRQALRRQVAETVSSPSEIDGELQYLGQVLAAG